MLSIEERNKLIVENMDLIPIYVSKLCNRVRVPIDSDDLYSYLQLALVTASEKYDETKGKKFRSYISSRLKSSSLEYLRNIDNSSVVSRLKQKMIDKIYNRLSHIHSREPTSDEIAEELNISEDDYRKLEVFTQNISMISIINSDNPDSPFDIMDDENISNDCILSSPKTPENMYMVDELLRKVIEVFNTVPRRDQVFYILYFLYNLNLTEIAKIFGLQTSYVCENVKKINSLISQHIYSYVKEDYNYG